MRSRERFSTAPVPPAEAVTGHLFMEGGGREEGEKDRGAEGTFWLTEALPVVKAGCKNRRRHSF